MIATRLHVKRHSNSAPNRPSITSIHSTSHLLIHQQHCKASRLPSEDVQHIDHDIKDDNDDDQVHKYIKVEKDLFTLF
jgi:hypothetical protein